MIEQFYRPGTIREALGLKARFRNRSAFMAGGTWLNSRDSVAPPEHCISLERVGLDRIEIRQGQLSVEAMCTLQRLIDERTMPAALRAAAAQIVNRNIRNVATIGGHVASRPPFSDLIPMLIALDARVVLASQSGAKTLRLADYVAKPTPGLITKLVLPKPGPGRRAACRKLCASANARSIVSAAVSCTIARGTIRDPIVALGGVERHVVRLTAIEQEMDGLPLPALDDLQTRVSRSVRPVATPAASAALLRYEAGVVVALCFRDALRQKGGRP